MNTYVQYIYTAKKPDFLKKCIVVTLQISQVQHSIDLANIFGKIIFLDLCLWNFNNQSLFNDLSNIKQYNPSYKVFQNIHSDVDTNTT